MTIEEIWKMVENSNPEDWQENHAGDGRTEIVFKNDVNLRFVDDLDYEAMENFNEEWATKHPDSHASKHELQLYYGASLIENIPVVSVDGGRARLPYPDAATHTQIPFRYYKAAQIGSQGNNLIDDYVRRSGLKVV